MVGVGKEDVLLKKCISILERYVGPRQSNCDSVSIANRDSLY